MTVMYFGNLTRCLVSEYVRTYPSAADCFLVLKAKKKKSQERETEFSNGP